MHSKVSCTQQARCVGGGLVTKSCLTLVTPRTVALQAPQSMGFSRQEYWSRLPCPPPGDLPNPGIELLSPEVSALQVDSLPSDPPGKPQGPFKNTSNLLKTPKSFCLGGSHLLIFQFSSVAQLCLTLWQPHGQQHAKPPCPSPTPRAYSNSCPLSWWCHPTISSSVIPFSSCLQSFPSSGSFQMSQFFTSGGQSIRVSASASVLPMNIQDWFPLGWTGWISLQSKGLSSIFSNTTVQKDQFFAQLSL